MRLEFLSLRLPGLECSDRHRGGVRLHGLRTGRSKFAAGNLGGTAEGGVAHVQEGRLSIGHSGWAPYCPTFRPHLPQLELEYLAEVCEVLQGLGHKTRMLQNQRVNEVLILKKLKDAGQDHFVSSIQGHVMLVLPPPLLQDMGQVRALRKGD